MADEQEQSNGDIFSSFMKSSADTDNKGSDEGGYKAKTSKERLQEIKDEEKRKEQEETDEAKKDSIFKASRINQSMVTKRQAQQNVILYIFVGGAAALLTLGIFKLAPKFSDFINIALRGATGL